MQKDNTSSELSKIVSSLKKVDLPGNKTIYSLPNDLVFVVNSQDNFVKMFDPIAGFGHEPHMIKKLMNFAMPGETYAEIGANYGDFVFQMAFKLGDNRKLYAFEPGYSVFQCLKTSIFLNGFKNIVAENLAVLDKEQDVVFAETKDKEAGTLGSHVVSVDTNNSHQTIKATSIDAYFKNIESTIDILRFDVEGSECKVLKGAENIISSSPNIRIFVEWQKPLLSKYESEDSMKECLANLLQKDFIFLDISYLNAECDYSIYQLSITDILQSDHLEILVIRENTLKEYMSLNNNTNLECLSIMNYYLFMAAIKNNQHSVINLLSKGADVNSISGIGESSFGATSLHMAVQNGFYEIVKLLLDAEANIEVAASNGLTPLCIAAQNKHTEIVRLLIEHNADIECKFLSGATSLYISSYLGDTATAILLMKAGANQNITVDGINITDIAKQNGYIETAKLFEIGVEAYCQQNTDEQFAGICGKEAAYEAHEA